MIYDPEKNAMKSYLKKNSFCNTDQMYTLQTCLLHKTSTAKIEGKRLSSHALYKIFSLHYNTHRLKIIYKKYIYKK